MMSLKSCRQATFDAVLNFLLANNFHNKEVNSIFGMCRQLDAAKLKYIINAPLVFFLSPRYFHLWKHYAARSKFYGNAELATKYAIVYAISAFDLYGICQYWTHFVCELYDGCDRVYYDSYADDLAIDFPQCREYTVPSAQQLRHIIGVRILITKESLI